MQLVIRYETTRWGGVIMEEYWRGHTSQINQISSRQAKKLARAAAKNSGRLSKGAWRVEPC